MPKKQRKVTYVMMCVSYCLDLFLLVVALSSYSTCSLWLKEENKNISLNCTNLFNFPVLIWLVSNVWDLHLNDAMEMISLPPANEVCEGYVFTGVCLSGGCAWQGGVHSRGHVCGRGACAWRGGGACAWLGACACMSPGRYYEIRSMRGRYASYWNAFLFIRAYSFHGLY